MNDYESAAAEVRNRINKLLKAKGFTQNSVAAGDAPAQKRLNSQLSHGANITLDTLLRILSACPDVSLDWLLFGQGEMYREATITEADSDAERNASETGQQNAVLSESFVLTLLAEKDKQIHTLLSILPKAFQHPAE